MGPYEEELWTHVPPSRRRVPAEVCIPPVNEAAGSWFRRVTVLASAYVAPPIIKMMTSCDLSKLSLQHCIHLCNCRQTSVDWRSGQEHQGKGSLSLSVSP
jgi:hypothetical protein